MKKIKIYKNLQQETTAMFRGVIVNTNIGKKLNDHESNI